MCNCGDVAQLLTVRREDSVNKGIITWCMYDSQCMLSSSTFSGSFSLIAKGLHSEN